MKETLLTLKRTVFLPKGSPGIFAVNEIRTDLRNTHIEQQGGKIYLSGEADLLLDYFCLDDNAAEAKGLLKDVISMDGKAKPWQALLTLPFELSEAGQLNCASDCKLEVESSKWFVVAPRALELELCLLLKESGGISPIGSLYEDLSAAASIVADRLYAGQIPLYQEASPEAALAEEDLAEVGFFAKEGGKTREFKAGMERDREMEIRFKKNLNAEISSSSYHEKMLQAEQEAKEVLAPLTDWQVQDKKGSVALDKKIMDLSKIPEPPSAEKKAEEKPQACLRTEVKSSIKAQLKAQLSLGLQVQYTDGFKLRLYRVLPNENLADIAIKKNVPLAGLAAKNKLDEHEKLTCGTYLLLP